MGGSAIQILSPLECLHFRRGWQRVGGPPHQSSSGWHGPFRRGACRTWSECPAAALLPAPRRCVCPPPREPGQRRLWRWHAPASHSCSCMFMGPCPFILIHACGCARGVRCLWSVVQCLGRHSAASIGGPTCLSSPVSPSA